jgi:hypothetical protein
VIPWLTSATLTALPGLSFVVPPASGSAARAAEAAASGSDKAATTNRIFLITSPPDAAMEPVTASCPVRASLERRPLPRLRGPEGIIIGLAEQLS